MNHDAVLAGDYGRFPPRTFSPIISPVFDSLLQTKLYLPATRPDWVERPYLLARLAVQPQTKLILVSAPAGYGKTTLITTWLRQQEATAVCWLALDENDNDPDRFLAYLAAAVQREGLVWQAQAPLPSLINEIASRERPLLLVLDDYHLINNTAVHEHLTFLLENAPPTFHLVLTTRADPPLPLARLRARGEIIEIRAIDLMFSAEETAVFLNQTHTLHLHDTDLQALANRTEGWIAGLQLAALSLQKLPPAARHAFIAGFAGDDRFILDYLLSEVLQQQPANRQTFLLHTALLDALNADLCAAVTGYPPADMQTMLEALEQENMFLLPLDNRREWYRYHHLFADLLRSRLTATAPTAVPDIHRRASSWYAAHNDLAAAIDHALAGQDWSQAAHLLQSAELLRQARAGQILAWLAQLPASVLANHARLAVMRLWVLLESGRLDEVESRLVALAETAVDHPDLAQELLVIEIHLARHRQDSARAIALSQELLAQLPTPPTPDSLPRHLAAVFGLAEAYRQAGDLAAASEQFDEAARLSEMAGSLDHTLRARFGAAQVLVERGKGETAVTTLQAILHDADPDFPEIAGAAQQLLAQAAAVTAESSDDQASSDLPEPLTERELDVLRWLDSDLTMAEIGAQLFISTNTIKTHLKRIYTKLGARGRFEAVAIARKNDLFPK